MAALESSPKVEVFYFDMPAKGEAIRLACAYAGLDWTDRRLTRDEFLELKETGVLKYGQVPALRVDGGTVICQSTAIMRYIARVSKPGLLYPERDLLKSAVVDSLLDAEVDLCQGVFISFYGERQGFKPMFDDAKVLEEVRKRLNDEIVPKHLGFFENILENESETGWLANTDTPSIVDFIIVPRLQWLVNFGNGIEMNILEPFPRLNKLVNKLMALDAIRDYYRKKGLENILTNWRDAREYYINKPRE